MAAEFVSEPSGLSDKQLVVVNNPLDGAITYAFRFGLLGNDGRPYLTQGLLETMQSTVGVSIVDIEQRLAIAVGNTVPVNEIGSTEDLRDRNIAAKAIFFAVHQVINLPRKNSFIR